MRPSKCFIGYDVVTFLGHKVGNGIREIIEDKIKPIVNVPRPSSKKEIRSFLGAVGFYAQFIDRYSELTASLTDLLGKGKPEKLVWSQELEEAFCKLKDALTSAPVLKLPELDKPF